MAVVDDNVLFPVAYSKGSTGGPDWYAEIVELDSGRDEVNTPQSAPRRRYDLKYSVRTWDEIYEILQLYLVVRGPGVGFRLLDLTDHQSCAPSQIPAATDQVLGTGDGATVTFDLNKVYSYQGRTHTRRIDKPYGTVLVAIDGVPQAGGFTADLSVGTVTFDIAPASGEALTWGGQFHVPVRFDGPLDQTSWSGEWNDIPSILLRELRV